MNKRLFVLMASLLLCGAVSAQAHFEVDTHAKDNNMPVVAQVVFDGVAITTGGYELGAFVGNATEARGSAQIQTGATLAGTYWIQVYYTSFGDDDETGATVTFKLYDGEDEYTAETTLTIDPEGAGTLSDPVEIVVNRAVTQTTNLAAGWTWWSTPIEQNGIDGLTMLENSLGNNGLYIESQTGGVENYYASMGYNLWWGDIEELDNAYGYKLNTTSSCRVTMTGSYANPENHPIQIQPNWNWIGYPCGTEQLLANADFQPSDNDVIQSQSDGSTYYEGIGWWPDFTMVPGEGYLYYSSATEIKEMVFSNNARGVKKHEDRERYWSNDVHAFKDNIVIIANAYLNQDEIRDDKIEIGAFVNGENRGSAKLSYFEPLDRYYALFTISGQKDDFIEFRLVDTRNGIENAECDTYFTFKPYSILGNLDNPIQLHFGTNETVALNLYPNPLDRNQSFTLNLPLGENALEVSIVNELGVIVRQIQGMIDGSSITGFSVSGIYFVKVVTETDKVYYSKLIVK